MFLRLVLWGIMLVAVPSKEEQWPFMIINPTYYLSHRKWASSLDEPSKSYQSLDLIYLTMYTMFAS